MLCQPLCRTVGRISAGVCRTSLGSSFLPAIHVDDTPRLSASAKRLPFSGLHFRCSYRLIEESDTMNPVAASSCRIERPAASRACLILSPMKFTGHSRGRDLHPRSTGYEPAELLLLHPAIKSILYQAEYVKHSDVHCQSISTFGRASPNDLTLARTSTCGRIL